MWDSDQSSNFETWLSLIQFLHGTVFLGLLWDCSVAYRLAPAWCYKSKRTDTQLNLQSTTSKQPFDTSADTSPLACPCQSSQQQESNLIIQCRTLANYRMTKKVHFDDPVQVQEYPITLGCNPGGCMGGPPITIDWEVLSSQTVSLQAYERNRRPLLRTSKQMRTRLLSSLGFLDDEILEAERTAEAVQRDRIESSCDESSDSFDAAAESITSKNDENEHELSISKLGRSTNGANNTLLSGRCCNFSLFQRSAQGTKAMIMFQKRRAVQQTI